MRNFTKFFLISCLLMLCAQFSWADTKKFSILVDNSANSLLTAADGEAWTPFEFGITVDDQGNVTRVAKDAADKTATVKGKVHSDHGAANLVVTIPVEGDTKFSVATCQYSTGNVKLTNAAGATVAEKTPEATCWKNNHSKVTEIEYKGGATTLTLSGMSYCAYVSVEMTKKSEGGSASFDNVASTFSWAQGDEAEATFGSDVAGGVASTKVSVGTDLTKKNSSFTLLGVKYGPYKSYTPNTSNPGCVTTDMVEYTLQMKKGVTFTPTSVEFDAIKEGSDNAYFSWSYTVDDVESNIVAYSDPTKQIRRNKDGSNDNVPVKHTETITGAQAGQKVTLRFYISNVASNKAMAIGNIKINGTMNGEASSRSFNDFELNFVNVTALPEKPKGVTSMEGSPRKDVHGLDNFKMVVPVDGPVKFTFGGCQYSGKNYFIKKGDEVLAEVDAKTPGCYHNGGTATWVYNSEEPATLTIIGCQYTPYIKAVACDLIPMRNVTYYDTDGTKVIEIAEVEGGSALSYKYGEADVTVPEGYKFRGWFNSTQATALKVKEGTLVQDNLDLYAKATPIEEAKVGVIFNYPLNSTSFYPEDHECFSTTGVYHDAQHGFAFKPNQSLSVDVAGNAVMILSTCEYGEPSKIVVKDAEGNQVGDSISIPCSKGKDGATSSITYNGPATTLTATLTNGGYIHNVQVYNVENTPQKNEMGYYEIAPNDGASLQLVLSALKDGDKVFLPNGVYDFGEKCLTTISAKNVSIIGESMDGTIIRNHPTQEGIGVTATLLNTSDSLYMQDLTIHNALDYYAYKGTGRAVAFQDKGKRTICKNVKMLSYQDTYYSNSANQFYWEDCEIHGAVDYLCGDGDVVYNRCHFVNESREKDSKAGSVVISAPYTSASCQWGYVFLDCSVESKCKDFTFARSWGGESKAQFLRTRIYDGSLNKARFTAAGMNVAAYKFKEYKTMDANFNIISPESKVIKFTHSSGNFEYETILDVNEAVDYTVSNIFGEWNPDEIAAQIENVEDGTVFLVDGKMTTVAPTSGAVRIANARGGFSQELWIEVTGINEVNAEKTNTTDGKFFKNGQVIIVKNGKTYNSLGQEIK